MPRQRRATADGRLRFSAMPMVLALIVLLTLPHLPRPQTVAAGQVSLIAPTSAARGSVVAIAGKADPLARVGVFFRLQGTTRFLGRTVTADVTGTYRTTFTANLDTQIFAESNGVRSVNRIVKAVGTTIDRPRATRLGATGVLTGFARPGAKVDVYFRAAGTTRFVDRRDVRAGTNGRWATTFVADRPYQVAAGSAEGFSARPVADAVPLSMTGPRTALLGQTVTIGGTTRPGAAVTIVMRKQGQTRYTVRGTARANAAGAYRFTYRADGTYAYAATGLGVLSNIAVTVVQSPSFAGNGLYRVGTDIPPGTYRTTRAVVGCYWSRVRGFSGTRSDVISEDFANARTIVDIAASDAGFTAKNCGTFSAALAPITSSPTAPFGDGVYIVNFDIRPGVWEAPGGNGCYWQRSSRFSGSRFDRIQSGQLTGPHRVTIAAGDRGFDTQGCGTWRKVG